MTTTTEQPTDADLDGRHDFDPYLGKWRLHTHKLVDVFDPDCSEWVEFEGTNEVLPILGGLGNVEMSHNELDPPFDGLALRLFTPATGTWRIWWMSTRQPGDIDVPVEGRFVGGRGVFLSDEMLAGRMTKVRYEWTGLTEGTPLYQQAFSYDDGETWKTNWVTTSTRLD